MASRLKLQENLEKILGNRNVYFQPPASVNLKYPCIIYDLAAIRSTYADNLPYAANKSYTLKLIHKDPDNTISEELAKLPMCKFDRTYVSDNLYHYVFSIVF